VVRAHRARHHQVNDEVEIVGLKPRRRRCTVGDVRKLLDEGQAGDNVGVLLRGTKREESSADRVWPAGSITRTPL